MDDKTFVEEYGMTRDEVLQYADAGTLVHAGVKGMKWGRRKADVSGGGSRPTGRQKRIARGNAQLARAGGKTSSAAIRLIGRRAVSAGLTAGLNIGLNALVKSTGGTDSKYLTVAAGAQSVANLANSMIGSIYNRLAIDVAAEKLQHVKLDDQLRFSGTVNSGLQSCLTLEANIDQGASQFRQDIAQTLFENGVAAIVPVVTDLDPNYTGGYDIKSLRVGEVVGWYPQHVRVSLYNDISGRKEELRLPKRMVAIVENPLYTVMNEPNSTLQRLIRKLGQLDSIDEQASSGKLDIIVQLPYVVRSETKKEAAKSRQRDLEQQLAGSKYGVGYIDATERITQLNRPAENNMLGTIQMLTDQLYNQLGLTPEVFNGTASEAVMLNYYNRTTEPILRAISEAMERVFLTKTARTQGQGIRFYRDPFKLVPVGAIAENADKLTRNEILSSNEMRSIMGYKPSTDKRADELRNANMPGGSGPPALENTIETEGDLQNGT